MIFNNGKTERTNNTFFLHFLFREKVSKRNKRWEKHTLFPLARNGWRWAFNIGSGNISYCIISRDFAVSGTSCRIRSFFYHIRAFLNIFRKLQSYSRMFWSYPESYYHIRSLSHIQKIVYLISLVIAESFTVSGIRDHIRNFLLYPVFMIVSKSFSPFHTVKVQESCVTILYFSRVKCEKQYTIYPFYIIYLKRKFIS
jgi:hypothetical protein